MKNNYEISGRKGILLNANESYKNISQKVLEEIKASIETIEFNRYPDNNCEEVCKVYASYVNVEETQVLCGNGSDDVLGLLIGTYVSKEKVLLTMEPDFSMYDYYVERYRGTIIKYKNNVENKFDVDDFIAFGKQYNPSIILFSNPNNPCGTFIDSKKIIKIVEAFKDSVIVIDEAYIEFSNGSMIPYISSYENLYVTTTLSKAFQAAAIRLGFLIGPKDGISKLKEYKVPYNVNAFTQKAATIIIQHKKECLELVEEIKKERDILYENIKELEKEDFYIYPSCTNYLYGRYKKLKEMQNAFQNRNIEIRYYENDYFRITIGSKEENAMVLETIKNL